MKTQKAKKVSGEWMMLSEIDKMEILWTNGFIVVRNIAQMQNLLECSPNYNYKGNPLTVYRVKIEIEAIQTDEI